MAAATASLPEVPRLRLALAAVAGLFALLLLGVWQVPQFLDWTRYRATIEVFASATLGQPVTIRGPISLTLLPQPVLTAAQVDVGGSGARDLSVHVDALRLRIALWPLLGGHVDARELVLRGPDLKVPWPAEPGVLLPRPPAWLAAFAARVENGRFTIGRLAFTGIDANVETLDTGALSASGIAQFSGQGWHFTARLTAAGPDGAAGLNVTLDGQGKANGLGASFAGQLAGDGTFAGTISSRGPNLAVLLPTPPIPFRADGRLTVGSGLAAVDDIALEIGGSPAKGAVALRVAPNQRLDIAVSASRLDLDAWLPVLLRTSTTVAGIDVPVGIDFSAESAPLGGGTLERVRAAFELAGPDLTVREASARLPGNGLLQLNGRIARGDPAKPQFDGDARLEAPVLRTTLRWLDEALPATVGNRLRAALPDGVAQRAILATHVVAGGGEIALQRITGTLDDAAISGSLGLKRGEPPAFSADLTLDRLTLDPWLPSHLLSLAEIATLAVSFDAEMRLIVRHATWAGVAVDDLALDAGVEAGSIQIRRAEGTARGAQVAASVVLGDGGRLSNGKLTVATKDASPLADLVPATWRATPALWHGPARLELQIGGRQEALALSGRLTLADATLDASPTLDLTSGQWTAAATLRHPGARRFIAALGLSQRRDVRGLTDWIGDGSLSLVTHLAGGPGRVGAEQFDLTAAALHARGDLAVDRNGEEPRVTGRIETEQLAVPLPDGGSEAPLPLDVLHGWRGSLQVSIGQLSLMDGPALRDVSATVSVAGAVLQVDLNGAKLGPGAVTGGMRFDAAAAPPALAIQGKVSDAIITGALGGGPVDLQSGRASGGVQLAASGYSPSAILATLGGQVNLMVNDGVISGFDLFRLKQAIERPDPKSAETAANDALTSGASSFDQLLLDAGIAHGDLTLDSARLAGVGGEAHITGGMNLAGRSINLRVALQPAVPNSPEVTIHISGPLDRPNRVPELAGLARWMAELAR